MSVKLNPKQRLFISAYLKDLNATSAALAAGYSKRSAYSQGQRLLKHAEISSAIQAKATKQLEDIDISVERVLRGLGNLAFFDMRKLYRSDGSLKDIPELDFDMQAGICGVEIDKLFERFGAGKASEVGTTTKVKIADRGTNLERLGRYHKLFTDKMELSTTDELITRLKAGRKRAGKDSITSE